ncbi:MAG: DUF1501 domain-containing protein [Planctomycetota bacterium]
MRYSDQRRSTLDRRALLGGLAGLVALGTTGLGASPRLRLGGRTLVLLQLAGGNDGLSTVVPLEDDAYRRARPRLGLPKQDLLPIGRDLALHPELARLRAHFDAGRVAVVSGCGYPNPNRSHFKSFEIWHTADPRGRAAGDGWIGRLLDARYGDEADPNRVVHVGTKLPYSLHSATHPAASFVLPESYRWAEIQGEVGRLEGGTTKAGKRAALEHVRGVLRDARTSSDAIRRAVAARRPGARYPNSPLGGHLATVAALVGAGLGGRVFSAELGGFDTHNAQLARHANLMRTLDAALGALLDDLGTSEAGRDTVVLVFSEFGRRVAENGSAGTDHGTAGPMFVLGHRVRGGHFGEPPSLTDLDAGDLRFTTDFRSVYGEAIDSVFELPHERVLGASFPKLGWSV